MPDRHRAVILDMDGLMLDTERMALRACQAAARDLGFELGDDAFAAVIGRNAAESRAILQAAIGPDFPYDEFRTRTAALYAEQVSGHGIAAKPGLEELLAVLERHRVPFGVATSTARARARWKLGQAGLGDRVDILVAGDEVRRSKPEPEIFIAAAARLAVESVSCVVLEDSLHGVRAAVAARMTTIMVPDLVAPDAPTRNRVHAVVPDLHAARPIVLGLLGIGQNT